MKKILMSLLIGVFMVVPQTMRAGADRSGLTVEPVKIEKKMNAGEAFSFQLKVTNESSEVIQIYFSARDLDSITSWGNPQFSGKPRTEDKLALSRWMTLEKDTATLGIKEAKEIKVRIQIPSDTPPGGYYGAVTLTREPPRFDVSGAAIGIGFEINSIIAIRVNGEVIENIRINSFATDKLIYSSLTPKIKFLTTIENLGTSHLRPRGPLEVWDFFGRKVATLIMNENGVAVLPNTKQVFEVVWGDEGVTWGKYSAIASWVYGEKDQKTMSRVTTFWVLPLNIMGPVVVGLLVLMGIWWWVTRWYVRYKLAAEGRMWKTTNKKDPIGKLAWIVLVLLVTVLILLVAMFFLLA